MTGRLFIFGLGYSGLEIAKLARAAGWSVAGTVTDRRQGRATARRGHRGASVRRHGAAARRALRRGDAHPLHHRARHARAIPRSGPARRCCSDARWLGYLSTTGVYGDHGGGWVDETTPPKPGQPRSIERLAAERAWQAMAIEAARRRHLPAARHLRSRPQRHRPGQGRHRAAHRQARPGLLAHPCRGHRRPPCSPR